MRAEAGPAGHGGEIGDDGGGTRCHEGEAAVG